jgi:hypothetical protein
MFLAMSSGVKRLDGGWHHACFVGVFIGCVKVIDSDEENQDIVNAKLSISGATEKFQDAVIESAGVGGCWCRQSVHWQCTLYSLLRTDFSDKLSSRRRNMYKSFVRRGHPTDLPGDGDFELAGGHTQPEVKETPLQKYRRLLYETKELEQDLSKVGVLGGSLEHERNRWQKQGTCNGCGWQKAGHIT